MKDGILPFKEHVMNHLYTTLSWHLAPYPHFGELDLLKMMHLRESSLLHGITQRGGQPGGQWLAVAGCGARYSDSDFSISAVEEDCSGDNNNGNKILEVQ